MSTGADTVGSDAPEHACEEGDMHIERFSLVLLAAPLLAQSVNFNAPKNYGALGQSYDVAIAVADFNGDGKPDLATDILGNQINVQMGNGDGTFQPALSTVIASHGAANFAVGDFNGDGKPDLVTAEQARSEHPRNNTGFVTVRLGSGDGTFQAPLEYKFASVPLFVAVGDFNKDGKLDVAVALNGGSVAILLGNGDGTFKTATFNTPEKGPISIAVGDFNGDGKPDLAVANEDSGTVSILLGNGDGTFQPQVAYAVGNSPRFVAVGDFDGDGKADLALSNWESGTVSILLGNGDGTFQPKTSNGVGQNSHCRGGGRLQRRWKAGSGSGRD
jgi:hypothetical protein